jgi:SAM-dependent methyltransferase
MSTDDNQRLLDDTQRSWDVATRAHNAHKREQATYLRTHDTLFPEERTLLGDVDGKDLVHLLCNAGQDTLSLAKHGARVTGVDLSGEAIGFARTLAHDTGIAATFVQSDVVTWLGDVHHHARFDVVFGSYGCLPWVRDLPAFMRGVHEVLRPGGVFVVVEFHPMAWSFGAGFALRDPYFQPDVPFSEPVGDYVGASGGLLAPSGFVELDVPYENPHAAHAWQHTVSDVVNAVIGSGLVLECVREWPYANGCRVCPDLVQVEGRRFTTPPGTPSLPLMLGLRAHKPL